MNTLPFPKTKLELKIFENYSERISHLLDSPSISEPIEEVPECSQPSIVVEERGPTVPAIITKESVNEQSSIKEDSIIDEIPESSIKIEE